MINFCLCPGYIAPIVSRDTDLTRRDNPSNVQTAVPVSQDLHIPARPMNCWPVKGQNGTYIEFCSRPNFH